MIEILTPATSLRLAAPADLQAEVSGLSADEAGALIDQASALIAAHCGQPFGQVEARETFRPGHRPWPLFLSRIPVVSVASIVEDGITLPATDWEADLDQGALRRLRSDIVSPWTARKVVVTYVAGYALPSGAPSGLARGCIMLATALAERRGTDTGLRSESLDGVATLSWRDPGNGGGLLTAEIRQAVSDHVDNRM